MLERKLFTVLFSGTSLFLGHAHLSPPHEKTPLGLNRYLSALLHLVLETKHLKRALEPYQRILRVPLILFVEPLLPVLVLEVLDDIEEGLVLPQQFLALTPALNGAPRCDKDGHLLKKFIFPAYRKVYTSS